jgi:hypothetical protein
VLIDIDVVRRHDQFGFCVDQMEDYARRKKMPRADVERWLSPNLSYEAE